jgi:hypothetical protein
MPREYFGSWNRTYGDWRNTETGSDQHAAVKEGGRDLERPYGLLAACRVLPPALLHRLQEAFSKTVRDRTWLWFTDDFMTRFNKDAGLLAIGTRWHVDDMLGRLMEKYPEAKVLRYPAIAEVDEGGRQAGEALFPQWKPLSAKTRYDHGVVKTVSRVRLSPLGVSYAVLVARRHARGNSRDHRFVCLRGSTRAGS